MTEPDKHRVVLGDTTAAVVNTQTDSASSLLSSSSSFPLLLPPLPKSKQRAQWDKTRLSMTKPLFVDEAATTARRRNSNAHRIHTHTHIAAAALNSTFSQQTTYTYETRGRRQTSTHNHLMNQSISNGHHDQHTHSISAGMRTTRSLLSRGTSVAVACLAEAAAIVRGTKRERGTAATTAVNTSFKDREEEADNNREEHHPIHKRIKSQEGQTQTQTQAAETHNNSTSRPNSNKTTSQRANSKPTQRTETNNYNPVQLLHTLQQEKQTLIQQIKQQEQQYLETQQQLVQQQQEYQQLTLQHQTVQSNLLMQQSMTEELRIQLLQSQTLVTHQQQQLIMYSTQIEQQTALVNQLLNQARHDEIIRKKLHNYVQGLRGNIRVLCRVRPVLHHENVNSNGSGHHHEVYQYSGEAIEKMIEVIGREEKSVDNRSSQRKSHMFCFDRVFPGASTQEQVFEEIEPLMVSCLDGYSVLVFAYGQTSSGKTHTMEGPTLSAMEALDTMTTAEKETSAQGPRHRPSPTSFSAPTALGYTQRGMTQRSIETLFQLIEQRSNGCIGGGGWTYTVEIQIMEIYNEAIRDLLVEHDTEKHEIKQASATSQNNTATHSHLHTQTHTPGHTHSQSVSLNASHLLSSANPADLTVTNMQTAMVTSADQVYPLLDRAKQYRQIGVTEANERSSRSHLIVQLRVHGQPSGQAAVSSTTSHPIQKATSGTLTLIDLAGSERLKLSKTSADSSNQQQQQQQQRLLKETTSINRSLSSLGDVILALAQHESHIPYRNSRLTHLLQPYLQGDSKILMLVNLCPLLEHVSESLCSLRFASKVNACQIRKK